MFCIAYTVLILEKTIEEAYTPFLSLPPLVPFRDVSFGISEYNILPIDAVYALIKGTRAKILDIYTFNYKEYMRTLSVDNGDITWMVPNKICVTSSMNEYPTMMWNGKYTWGIGQYLQYFKEKGVTDVIRLEDNTYDTKIWERNGIRFYDLVFTDGDCPLQRVLVYLLLLLLYILYIFLFIIFIFIYYYRRFFDIVDKPNSVIAIHCKSGCGKSSVLIAAYLIKHYHFTTDEAIMWMRMFRPGSVFGIQQKWLRVNQEDLWNQKHFDEKLVEMSTDSQKKMIQQFKAERNKLKTPIFLDSIPASSPIKVPKKSSTTSSGMVTSASVPSIMSREYKLELFSRTRGCISPDSTKYRTKLDGTIQTVSVPQYWSLNNSMNKSMYSKTVMPQ